jgi:hypothetical protein
MRAIGCTVVTLLLSASTVSKEAPQAPPPSRLTGTEVQFLMLVSARFYCAKARWPSDIGEMIEYRDSSNTLPNIAVRRDTLLRAKVSYSTEPTFQLRAPTFEGDKLLVVEATQDVPICADGNTKLQGGKLHLSLDHDATKAESGA